MSILLLVIFTIISSVTFIYSMLINSDIPINYSDSELYILYILSILSIIILGLSMRYAKRIMIKIMNYIVTFFIVSINLMKLVANLNLENSDQTTLIYEIVYITILVLILIIAYASDYKNKKYA